MDFVDRAIIRLADPTTRAGLFDQASLEQLAGAAYDLQGRLVQGPFQPLFDDFSLGVSPKVLGTIEGTWRSTGTNDFTEIRLHTSGLGNQDASVRIDALWRGSVVVRSVPIDSTISSVDVEWPDIERIDAMIISDLGALPTDADTLEQERRTRLVAQVRAVLDQPQAFTDTAVDPWLLEVGATSVGDLLTRFRGVVHPAGVRVAFSPPSGAPPSPLPLPITAAVMIRDAGFSVASLLVQSKLVREQLAFHGIERPHEADLKPRATPVIVWIIPESVFDDDDWPGATQGMNQTARRAARRSAAGDWLAREGIGLVAVTAN